MLGAYIVLFFAGRMRTHNTNWLGQQTPVICVMICSPISSLCHSTFDSRSAGSVLVRAINDVNALEDLFTSGVVQSLTDVFLLLGIAAILFSLHAKLALATMITLPLMFLLSTKIRAQIRRAWREVRLRNARINSHLNEAIQGIRVTKAFVQEEENEVSSTT